MRRMYPYSGTSVEAVAEKKTKAEFSLFVSISKKIGHKVPSALHNAPEIFRRRFITANDLLEENERSSRVITLRKVKNGTAKWKSNFSIATVT